MKAKKEIGKQIISYIVSLALAGLLVNGILYANYWHPEKYFISNYSSNALHKPDSICVEGREGFAILHTDANGYFNEKPLDTEGSYVLCLGSSDTQAKSIPNELNYCEVLEQKLSADGVHTDVYNAGMDAAGLDEVLGHFHAAMQKFQTADLVVIEMSWFPEAADLKTTIADEAEYQPFDLAAYEATLSGKDKLKNKISAFPLPRVLNNQITKLSEKKPRVPFVAFLAQGKTEAVTSEHAEVKADAAYQQLLMKAMEKVRKEADDKPVVLVFSTTTAMERDGKLVDTVNPEEMQWLQNACKQNEIEFVDMADAYIARYEQEKELYRGFWNTSPGSGHLNRTGHALIAEALYRVIQEDELLR